MFYILILGRFYFTRLFNRLGISVHFKVCRPVLWSDFIGCKCNEPGKLTHMSSLSIAGTRLRGVRNTLQHTHDGRICERLVSEVALMCLCLRILVCVSVYRHGHARQLTAPWKCVQHLVKNRHYVCSEREADRKPSLLPKWSHKTLT